ncbi:MAG: hypothetical protein QNJ31_00715 [Candidatus Caenarcaniphilales bacterium]|nr:hypothetical protein [Candidatus Caenarcaniphilales bacterium]
MNRCIFLKRFLKDEKGAVNEFLGLIFFLLIIFCVLIPMIVELLAYTGQAQEADRLTKIAAKRACTLLANPTIGVAGDLKQGSLGMATSINIMQPLVNQVFRNEASHPEEYFQNTVDGENIDLKVFDLAGEEIRLSDRSNWVEAEDPDGNRRELLLVGTNTEASLCPSGANAQGGWKYCLEGNDDLVKQQLRNTGINEKNADLIQRMERFQAGRCLEGENCRNDFIGRIDRCTVCVTKTRQSIFQRTFFRHILSCQNSQDSRMIPCAISTCATEKLTRASTKRGYNPAYQDRKNLGNQFNAIEVNYREQQNEQNTLLKEKTRMDDQRQKAANAQDKEGTNNLFHDMRCQFLSVDDPAAEGCWD